MHPRLFCRMAGDDLEVMESKTDEQIRELKASQARTDEQVRRTDAKLDRIGQQLGTWDWSRGRWPMKAERPG